MLREWPSVLVFTALNDSARLSKIGDGYVNTLKTPRHRPDNANVQADEENERLMELGEADRPRPSDLNAGSASLGQRHLSKQLTGLPCRTAYRASVRGSASNQLVRKLDRSRLLDGARIGNDEERQANQSL